MKKRPHCGGFLFVSHLHYRKKRRMNQEKYIGAEIHQAISAAVLDDAGKLIMESRPETILRPWRKNGSENELQPKLCDAETVVHGVGDLPESGAGIASDRRPELGMIKQVEELGAEFEVHAFAD